jgi:hypothetical protein
MNSEQSIEQITQENCRKAYEQGFRHALRLASDAVARLTDGDSPIHDHAIVDACNTIEATKIPAPPCEHSFVQPHGADGRGYLNRRVCRKCGEHRKLVGTQWVAAAPPADFVPPAELHAIGKVDG